MSSYFVFETEGGAEVAVLDTTEVPAQTVQEIEEALKPVADELEEQKAHKHATRPLGKPETHTAVTVPHMENNSVTVSEKTVVKEKFRTKVKEKVKIFAKNYIHNMDPRGKDKYWWAGAIGKLGATVTAAVVAPVAVPAVALSTASFRVGQYGAEMLNKRIRKKRLGEEGYTKYLEERQKKFPKGVSAVGRVARGTGAYSALTAIGMAA